MDGTPVPEQSGSRFIVSRSDTRRSLQPGLIRALSQRSVKYNHSTIINQKSDKWERTGQCVVGPR